MAIYDKVADLKNTFPRLVVQYMKKYYKFCNISSFRITKNSLYKIHVPVSLIVNHQSLVKQPFLKHQIVDKRLHLNLLC